MKDFEQHLIEKYPDLFPKDENGNTIPPDCGICCPAGWETIVETLCACINSHVKHADNVQIKKWRYKIKQWFYKKTINKICYKLGKFFDPYKTHPRTWMTMEEKKQLDEEHEFEIKARKIIYTVKDFFRPNWEFKKVYPRGVTIGQIKEKFGGLRFYYEGGDRQVAGMISLAECLSYKTCENCGKEGCVQQNGWWTTLCEDCKKPKE